MYERKTKDVHGHGPSILASLFVPLMLAGLPNHFPLLTMFQTCSCLYILCRHCLLNIAFELIVKLSFTAQNHDSFCQLQTTRTENE